MASAAAIVTGTNAITFNAAGLNAATVAGYGVNLSNATNLITAYYVGGEILSAVQEFTPLPNAAGMRIQLAPGSDASSPILHDINQVLLAIGIPSSPAPMGPFPEGGP